MTTTATKTYQVTVIERALAYYEVEAEDALRRRRELGGRRILRPRRRGPRHRRPVQRPRAAARRHVADSAAIGMGSRHRPTSAGDKPYSVLLLYPDYVNDDGTETFYAFVEAPDPIAAVAMAQRQAVALQRMGREAIRTTSSRCW